MLCICGNEGADSVAPVGGMDVPMCPECVKAWDAAAQVHPTFKILYGKPPSAIAAKARASLESELRVFADTWTADRKPKAGS